MAFCGKNAKWRYELICLLLKTNRRNVRMRLKRRGLSDSAIDMVKYLNEKFSEKLMKGLDRETIESFKENSNVIGCIEVAEGMCQDVDNKIKISDGLDKKSSEVTSCVEVVEGMCQDVDSKVKISKGLDKKSSNVTSCVEVVEGMCQDVDNKIVEEEIVDEVSYVNEEDG